MKVLFLYLFKQNAQSRTLRVAPLTHSLLAAYTPPEVDVSIIDESFQEIDFDMEVDLVAVTIIVPQAPRAHEVAREFRRRGKTMVCGGSYPSLLPDEAAQHFDAVVIGQGDQVWPQLLNDFRRGDLKQFYRGNPEVPPETVPFARRELLHPKGYSILNTIQATRGCPFSCTFCTSYAVYPGFSALPVERVVREIDQLEGGVLQRKIFAFLDNNLMADPLWSKRLFREMTPLRKFWITQATFSITKDQELVKLAAKSGCKLIFFGLESFNTLSLRSVNKSHNTVERYRDGIKLLHDCGISVSAGIIFGFDDDHKDIFSLTLEHCIELGIDIIGANILVPYPGTAIFEQLDREDRIIRKDWSKYDGKHAVFLPKHMTAEELEDGRNWFNWEFHSYNSILRRAWISRSAPWITLPVNLAMHRVRNGHVEESRKRGKDFSQAA